MNLRRFAFESPAHPQRAGNLQLVARVSGAICGRIMSVWHRTQDIAPLIRATSQPSFPAKAGNPVCCGRSGLTAAVGILGRPVKPDDDVGD